MSDTTHETTSPHTEMPEMTAIPEPRPRRRGPRRKRLFFQPPPPAPAVRELWKQASEQERQRAHRACVAILEYWLGHKTKGEVGAQLEVPPLRVWQLSQQALSGMLAGLLKQPRTRRGAKVASPPSGDDPRVLRRRIEELETKLRRTEDLVRVLRTAPWTPATSAATDSKTRRRSSGAGRTRRTGAKRGTKRAQEATRLRDATRDRTEAPGAPAEPADDGGRG